MGGGRMGWARWRRYRKRPLFVLIADPAMHVLVAGGAGYIGSVLVPSLLEHGHRVTVLDRLFFGDTLGRTHARFGEKLRVVRGDVRDFERSILTSLDAVVDLSGI